MCVTCISGRNDFEAPADCTDASSVERGHRADVSEVQTTVVRDCV